MTLLIFLLALKFLNFLKFYFLELKKQIADMDEAMARAVDIGENDVSFISASTLIFADFVFCVHVILVLLFECGCVTICTSRLFNDCFITVISFDLICKRMKERILRLRVMTKRRKLRAIGVF